MNETLSDTKGVTPEEVAAENLTGVPSLPLDTEVPLTMEEKVDFIFDTIVKVRTLVDSITPAQVEKVQKLQSDPFAAKLLARFTK